MTEAQWPLKKTTKGPSGPFQCNYLWNEGNIFVMDNHRLALWCWLQTLEENDSYSLFHIDAHYDADPKLSQIISKEEIEKLKNISLKDYINLKIQDSNLIAWDNYLPLLETIFPNTKEQSYCSTHHIGLKGNFDKEIEIYELYRYLDDILISKKNWIFNLDLDYFYARDYKENPLIDERLILKIFSIIKLAYDEERIQCLTVALSPECCGSWENAERILKIFCQAFEIDFNQFS